jgi:hypothetical protein
MRLDDFTVSAEGCECGRSAGSLFALMTTLDTSSSIVPTKNFIFDGNCGQSTAVDLGGTGIDH